MREVAIPTPDGDARSYVFTPPSGQGPWPGVIFFMDAPAIRPCLFDMSQRLADHGYYVLLPDMFWRAGPYEPINIAEAFAGDESRRAAFAKLRGSTDAERSSRDITAFLDWLSKQPEVKGDKVGVTGYCMGAGLALRAAGEHPDRVIAAGGFHGGRLATNAPDSPHLLAPKIQAQVYVGGASDDPSFPDAMKARLETALREAGVRHTVETYPARHGWVPSDTPVHDAAAAERHWQTLFALLDGALKH